MKEFIVKPHASVIISYADQAELSLQNFHIIAIAEPDPDSWMPQYNDKDNLVTLLKVYCDLIQNELWPEEGYVERPPDVDCSKLIWVGEGGHDYFNELSYQVYVSFSQDYEAYDDLRFYIQGVAAQHPTWRVAVIGAMFEDDVMRVANAIQESGLEATVLGRYCLSDKHFINLDKLSDYVAELRENGWSDDVDFIDNYLDNDGDV